MHAAGNSRSNRAQVVAALLGSLLVPSRSSSAGGGLAFRSNNFSSHSGNICSWRRPRAAGRQRNRGRGFVSQWWERAASSTSPLIAAKEPSACCKSLIPLDKRRMPQRQQHERTFRKVGFFRLCSRDSRASLRFSLREVLMLPVVTWSSCMKERRPGGGKSANARGVGPGSISSARGGQGGVGGTSSEEAGTGSRELLKGSLWGYELMMEALRKRLWGIKKGGARGDRGREVPPHQ